MKKILVGAIALAGLFGCSSHYKKGEATPSAYEKSETWRAPAAECMLKGDYKECKNARTNDWADQYLLDNKGNLFRAVGGQKCQVTDKVSSFKISQHRSDSAVIYYEREDALYVVHNQGTKSGNCPSVSKKKIMDNVKEYSLVPNPNTFIVNAALDKNGSFVAWEDVRPAYSDNNVTDYVMNTCYKQEGKSFNTVVLFTIDRSGSVTKVRVEESGGIWVYNKSNTTNKRYNSLKDFKESERVCQ
ncbi:MAG: hypothetical protein AABY64_04355 [Bdellovibrionota bacterium]